MLAKKDYSKFRRAAPGIIILSIYLIYMVVTVLRLFLGYRTCGYTDRNSILGIIVALGQVPFLVNLFFMLKFKKRIKGWLTFVLIITIILSVLSLYVGRLQTSGWSLFGCNFISG